MKSVWMLAAAGALMSSAAMASGPGTDATAQPAPSSSQNRSSQPMAEHAANPSMHPGRIQQQVAADMRNAGFTDVKVVPDSFLVMAKDKSGDPVTMMINPNSVTEVVGANAGGAANEAPDETATAGATFETLPQGARLESKIVGLDVHNADNQDIGTIKDIAYNGTHIRAYIIGVGGLLGVGDHYVAVNPSAVRITYDHGSNTWHAAMNTTADALKSAPQYKYPTQNG